MLIFFVGSDVGRAKEEALKRAKGAEVVRLGEGGEPFNTALGFVEQRGMFAPKVALIIDRALESADGKELILEHGDALASADALVIAIEEKIDALTKKKLPKGSTTESFESGPVAEYIPPNVFGLTDAYAAGDRKGAWVMYRGLIESGVSAEEVHGALAWSVRGMVLAAKTKSAAEAGMKDYPYKKAQSAVRRIGLPAVEKASAELVALYHDARMGKGDMEDLVELFLLKK